MRRIADLHSGEAKTDARDAAIIAEAARTLPHALRSLKLADEQIAELSMLCGFDDDLAAQTTQASNRIRGLLTQIHPALERVLGPRLDHPAVLDLLQRYPSPEKLALLGEKKLATQLCKLAPRLGKRLAADIPPGTDTANRHRPRYECCCRCSPTPGTPAHHAALAKRRSDSLNRPGFPGECFICELRLPDHCFRWKHNKLFSASAGGVWPSLPSNRRLLYQSTHVSVASSTSARFFQLLRCITSAL